MADKDGGGGVSMDLFWAFIVIATLFGLWIQGGGPMRAKNEGLLKSPASISKPALTPKVNSNNSNPSGSRESKNGVTYSPYRGKIRLGRGTAASTYQPGQEYITLQASGNKTPINIGGWTLKNGRDRHLYVVSGDTIRVPAVSIKIPTQGVALYDPYHPLNNKRGAITLKSGERAVITTGNPATFGGVKIKDNFKLNRCLGYLEDNSGSRAYPSLKYNCPASKDVPGITELDNACYDFVRSIRSCHTPKDVYIKDEGYCLERNCKLTSYCKQFAKDNFSFDTCFARYAESDNFVGPEWRVFLGQTWEIWVDRRETISLYDRQGLLVDEISY